MIIRYDGGGLSGHDKKEESLVYSNENQAKGLIISVASRGK